MGSNLVANGVRNRFLLRFIRCGLLQIVLHGGRLVQYIVRFGSVRIFGGQFL